MTFHWNILGRLFSSWWWDFSSSHSCWWQLHRLGVRSLKSSYWWGTQSLCKYFYGETAEGCTWGYAYQDTAIITKQKTRSLGDNIEKLDPLHTVSRNAKWCNCMENSMAVPQNIKRTIIWSNSLPLGIYSKEFKSQSWRYTSTSKFTATLFTITNLWK